MLGNFMLKVKVKASPRNPFVKLALFKKAGKHGKSNKAMRRLNKVKLYGEVAI
jgi:hypothetical protein